MRSVPDRQEAPDPADLHEALEVLAEMPRRGSSGPLEEFVARLAVIAGVDVPDSVFDPLPPDIRKALRDRAARDAGSAPPRLHLSIDLSGGDDFAAGSDRLPASVVGSLREGDQWVEKREVPCERDLVSLKAAVAELVDSVTRAEGRDLSIGFVLPRALFALAPERWEAGEDALREGVELWKTHAVVLHSAERLVVPGARQQWQHKFEQLERVFSSGEEVNVLWITPEEARDSRTLRDRVRANDERPCLALRFVLPSDVSKSALKKDPLIAALAEGAPFVVWFDEEPEDWDNETSGTERVVQDGEFSRLPLRVKDLRLTVEQDQRFLANSLRLLWDHPKDLPPVLQAEVR